MTPDQIKALAKQAGVHPYEHSEPWRRSISFTPDQLAEFVRLVREQAFVEAAQIALDAGYKSNGIPEYEFIATKIMGLK